MTTEPTPEDCDTLAAKLETLVVELTEGEREVLARVINAAAISVDQDEVTGFAFTAFETELGATLGKAALGLELGVEAR